MSLRQKQIREVLDEDTKINRQVVNNLFKQVKVFGDDVRPTNLNEAVNTDSLFNIIDKLNGDLIDAMISIDNTDISFDKLYPPVPAFNLAMNMAKTAIQKNYNSRNAILAKINEMIAPLNSICISLSKYIYDYYIIHKDDKKDKSFSRLMVQLVTYLAIYLMMRKNINDNKIQPINNDDIDSEFNNLVKTYDPAFQNVIIDGMNLSALSGMRTDYDKNLKNEIKRLTAERGRPLTKDEELLLSMRVGNFRQFKPFLTIDLKKAFDPLNLNLNFDDINQYARNPSSGNRTGTHTDRPMSLISEDRPFTFTTESTGTTGTDTTGSTGTDTTTDTDGSGKKKRKIGKGVLSDVPRPVYNLEQRRNQVAHPGTVEPASSLLYDGDKNDDYAVGQGIDKNMFNKRIKQ